MILNTPKKRQQIIEKTTNDILTSMRLTMPYIDVSAASKILGYSDRGAIKTLRRMCAMNLLREHKQRTKKNQLMSVFVATKKARDEMGGTWEEKLWTIKNWRISNHHHDMLLHPLAKDLRKLAFDRGYKDHRFVKTNRLNNKRRADFAIKIDDIEYQIELELTLKSTKRYQEIFRNTFNKHTKAPHVWVLTSENHLNRFYKIAHEAEALDHSIIVLWNQENGELKWIKTEVAPLFQKIKKETANEPNKEYEIFTSKETDNPDEEMYDQHDVESLLIENTKKHQDEMTRVMFMSVWERKKYIEEYRKTHRNPNKK